MSGFRIAIVGASGAVGREVIRVLEARKFPVSTLALYSSLRSAGQSLEFQGEAIRLEALPAQLPPVDIVFACAGSGVAREYAPLWAKSATVIDNSSAFRLEADVPLIVPEVNPPGPDRQPQLHHRDFGGGTLALAPSFWGTQNGGLDLSSRLGSRCGRHERIRSPGPASPRRPTSHRLGLPPPAGF